MKIYLLLALVLGTGVMLGIMLYCRKWIRMGVRKTVLFSVLLTLCGFASVKLMYFVENGKWSGLSFFGAVLFLPPALLLWALLLRERWTTLLDLSAPSVCGMLAVMKLECLRSGCCGGRLLWSDAASGIEIYFPSREVELVTAVMIAVILVQIIKKGKHSGELYPLFMVIYGVTRFIWNWFRKTSVGAVPMPIGNIWALVSIAIGVIWILLYQRKRGIKTPEGRN